MYVASHRLKAGEALGASKTASDINKFVLNRFIVPPKEQRNESGQLNLLCEESGQMLGIDLDSGWSGRTVLLDCRYLVDEFDQASGSDWLTSIFAAARRIGINAIPVLKTDDLLGERGDAYKHVLPENSTLKLILCLDENCLDSDMIGPVNKALELAGLSHADCGVIMDFSSADFSDVETAAGVLQGSLELVQEFGAWHHISFCSSSYPVKNPGIPSDSVQVKRYEWLAWKAAIESDENAADNLVFGDFGADSSKIKFTKSKGKGGPIPIRHLRYTTDDAWLVVRGSGEGKQGADIKWVCQTILDSGFYDSPQSSNADSLINQLAKGSAGVTAGTAKDWRAMNTERHITKVVRDIGMVSGIEFNDIEKKTVLLQYGLDLSLLDED